MQRESFVFIDSQKSIGTANSFVFMLDTKLRGVHQAELVSATFVRQSTDQNVILDIEELKGDGFVSNSCVSRSFAVIPVAATPLSSNVVFTTSGFFQITKYFDNFIDLDRLTVKWKDQSGSVVPMSANTLLLKIKHIK
jgi:hypothetical protein